MNDVLNEMLWYMSQGNIWRFGDSSQEMNDPQRLDSRWLARTVDLVIMNFQQRANVLLQCKS